LIQYKFKIAKNKNDEFANKLTTKVIDWICTRPNLIFQPATNEHHTKTGQQYSALRRKNQNKQRDEITKTNKKIFNICGNHTYLIKTTRCISILATT
jgi:hypothetical protein